MAVYSHFQEAKSAQPLPMAAQIGACITCSYWNVETPRPASEIEMVGVCVQPKLEGFALIVSGSSACNQWHDKPEAGSDAHAYAEHKTAQA